MRFMGRLGTATLVALAACLLYCAASAGAGPTTTDLGAVRAVPCDGTLGQCAVASDEEQEVGGGDAQPAPAAGARRRRPPTDPSYYIPSYVIPIHDG